LIYKPQKLMVYCLNIQPRKDLDLFVSSSLCYSRNISLKFPDRALCGDAMLVSPIK